PRRVPHDRSAVRGRRLPRLLPFGLARRGVEGDNFRAFEFVAYDDDGPLGDDRRRAGPEIAGRDRRRHLELPQLLAGQVVAAHAARAEKGEDPLAVGRGRGRRRAAALLEVPLDRLGRGFPAPRLLPVGALIRDRVELATLERREDELVPGGDRRGQAARRRHFPLEVLGRAELHGRVLAVRHAPPPPAPQPPPPPPPTLTPRPLPH